MSPAQEVLEKALELDEHDRTEVVEALLESLEVVDSEEEATFVAELDRRAAEMEAGVVKGILWEELWGELQREPQRTEVPPALGIAETVQAALLEDRRNRYRQAAALLRQWREDDSGYDEKIWTLLEEEFGLTETHRVDGGTDSREQAS